MSKEKENGKGRTQYYGGQGRVLRARRSKQQQQQQRRESEQKQWPGRERIPKHVRVLNERPHDERCRFRRSCGWPPEVVNAPKVDVLGPVKDTLPTHRKSDGVRVEEPFLAQEAPEDMASQVASNRED